MGGLRLLSFTKSAKMTVFLMHAFVSPTVIFLFPHLNMGSRRGAGLKNTSHALLGLSISGDSTEKGYATVVSYRLRNPG